MQFGICTKVENAAAVKSAGWDFVEESVQGFLRGTTPDTEWTGTELARNSALPVPAANMLVPGSHKITGPDADIEKLRTYMQVVLSRAAKTRTTTLVFGSGGARNIPDGFSRDSAKRQIIDFLNVSAPIAKQHGVMLVVEHLNKSECNVINTVAEGMEYVRAVNHPNVRCLVDSYHFWLENEPLENLKATMPWIRHVHLADKDGRVPPGESKKADYRPLFLVLKAGKYSGLISVEALGFNDFTTVAPRVLDYLKKQWTEA